MNKNTLYTVFFVITLASVLLSCQNVISTAVVFKPFNALYKNAEIEVLPASEEQGLKNNTVETEQPDKFAELKMIHKSLIHNNRFVIREDNLVAGAWWSERYGGLSNSTAKINKVNAWIICKSQFVRIRAIDLPENANNSETIF